MRKKIVTTLIICISFIVCAFSFAACNILDGILGGNGGNGGGNDVNNGKDSVTVEKIELNPTELTLKVGESSDIYLTVYPKGANVRSIIWDSSDEKVVSVKDGRVQALDGGTATIYCVVYDNTTYGKFEATCEVTVIKESSGDQPVVGDETIGGKVYVFEDLTFEGVDDNPNKDIILSMKDYMLAAYVGETITFGTDGTATDYSQAMDMTVSGTYTVENDKITVTTTAAGSTGTIEFVIVGDTLVSRHDMSAAGQTYAGVYMVAVYRLQA